MSMKPRILITAGPTHEPIDGVRYLANRSSGRMGIALANAALEAGADVTLVLGPTHFCPEEGVNLIRFQSTRDLEQILKDQFPQTDTLIMAAAVADYRPAEADLDSKLPRQGNKMILELEPTPDLVAGCAAVKRADQTVIAFALEEPAKLVDRAQRKMRRKKVDAIVANPLQTMDATDIAATIFTADGQQVQPEGGKISKADFAGWLVNWVAEYQMEKRNALAAG